MIEADLEEILDGELYEKIELANLYTLEEAASEVVSDIENLKLFYNDVAVASLSIALALL